MNQVAARNLSGAMVPTPLYPAFSQGTECVFFTITPRIPAAGRTGALEAGETENEAKMKNRRPNRHKTQKTMGGAITGCLFT